MLEKITSICNNLYEYRWYFVLINIFNALYSICMVFGGGIHTNCLFSNTDLTHSFMNEIWGLIVIKISDYYFIHFKINCIWSNEIRPWALFTILPNFMFNICHIVIFMNLYYYTNMQNYILRIRPILAIKMK